MAIATVVTRGYGNGTVTGAIPLVITRGYVAGAAVIALESATITPFFISLGRLSVR